MKYDNELVLIGRISSYWSEMSLIRYPTVNTLGYLCSRTDVGILNMVSFLLNISFVYVLVLVCLVLKYLLTGPRDVGMGPAYLISSLVVINMLFLSEFSEITFLSISQFLFEFISEFLLSCSSYIMGMAVLNCSKVACGSLSHGTAIIEESIEFEMSGP